MTPPAKLDGGFARQLPDFDAGLTDEWVDSLDAVIDAHGPTRPAWC